jgi:hypothetical protein
MTHATPTGREVLLTGVLPTIVALLAATFILIERLQIDWSLSGDGPGDILTGYRGAPVPWLPMLVVFGLGHIVGVGWLAGSMQTPVQILARFGKALVFVALHLPILTGGGLALLVAVEAGANYFFALEGIPHFLIMLLAGLPSTRTPEPYQQTFLFQALIRALVATSYVLPGMGFGLLLRAAVGSTNGDVRIRSLKAYVIGGAIASSIFFLATGTVDSKDNPYFALPTAWLDAVAVCAATILCCGAIWIAALVAKRSANITRACGLGLSLCMLAALPLVGATQWAASNHITMLDGTPFSEFFRSGLPRIDEPVGFRGARFVGPSSIIRGRHRDSFIIRADEWRPLHRIERDIWLETHSRVGARRADCMAISAARTICADLALAGAAPREPWASLSVQEYDSSVPWAVLSHWAVPLPKEGPATLEGLKAGLRPGCEIELSGIPAKGVFVTAPIDCSDDWPREALRLKALLDTWFEKAAP